MSRGDRATEALAQDADPLRPKWVICLGLLMCNAMGSATAMTTERSTPMSRLFNLLVATVTLTLALTATHLPQGATQAPTPIVQLSVTSQLPISPSDDDGDCQHDNTYIQMSGSEPLSNGSRYCQFDEYCANCGAHTRTFHEVH